jgi:hypothetical protein
VAPQHEVALEAEQQVLPDRLDGDEATPVQSWCDPGGGRPRVWRLHLDAFADERLETPCGAVQRIALGHEARLAVALVYPQLP